MRYIVRAFPPVSSLRKEILWCPTYCDADQRCVERTEQRSPFTLRLFVHDQHKPVKLGRNNDEEDEEGFLEAQSSNNYITPSISRLTVLVHHQKVELTNNLSRVSC